MKSPYTLPALLFVAMQTLLSVGVDATPAKPTTSEKFRYGAALIREQQCNACHIVNGKGAAGGVELDNTKRSKQFIIEQLLDPEGHVAKHPHEFDNYPNLMPTHQITKQEAESIAEYLVMKDKKRAPVKTKVQKQTKKS